MNKYLIALFIMLLVCLIAFGIIQFSPSPLTTELARYGYLEDVVTVDGMFVRDETLIGAQTMGVFESTCFEGQRVSKGERIGTVYNGEISKEASGELNEINNKIIQLTNNESGLQATFDDVYKINAQINVRVENIINYAIDQNGQYIENAKLELDRLLDNRLIVEGKKEKGVDEMVQLTQRKKELEKNLNKSDVYAGVAGVFSYVIDGFEDKITVESLKQITPTIFDDLQKIEPITDKGVFPGKPIAKISNNFLWYYVFNLTQNELDTIKQDDLVYLRMSDDVSDTIPASVEYISQIQDERVFVVLSSTRFVQAMSSGRKTKLGLVKRRFEGYKIPQRAIHVKDGVTGVYIICDSVATFRPISVLYSKDDEVVISSIKSEQNNISLYDDIIVDAKEIIEGKLLR